MRIGYCIVGLLVGLIVGLIASMSLSAGTLDAAGFEGFRINGPETGAARVPILELDAELPLTQLSQDTRVPALTMDGALSQRTLSSAQRLWIDGRRKGGDGGGASVDSLTVIQTSYVESNCPPTDGTDPVNTVLLIWTEDLPNPDGVDILVDDEVLGNVADGTVLFIDDVPAGVHVFTAVDPTTEAGISQELEVLDAQPMADVTEVQNPETVPINEDGTCGIDLQFKNLCPVPDTYAWNIEITPDEGDPLAGTLFEFPSFFWGVTGFTGGPGEYRSTIIGFLNYNDNPNALYRSCFISMEEPTRVECDETPCDVAPSALSSIQWRYANQDDLGETNFDIIWTPGEIYESQNIFIDGALFDSIPGDWDGINFTAPGFGGTLTFGVQGVCAEGTTDVAEVELGLAAETPHSNPVEGDAVECEYDENTGSHTNSWINADCSSRIWRFQNPAPTPEDPFNGLVANPDAFVVGNSDDDLIENTFEVDEFEYQFWAWGEQGTPAGNVISLSQRVECGTIDPGVPQFIRGICNDGSVATDTPQLTDGIFVLLFLFQGGVEPGCMEACDVNASGAMDLTDGVYVFNYLFGGGPAPVGWLGDPAVATCEDVVEGMDCAIPNGACETAGE